MEAQGMRTLQRNNRGFTLIEVIASLVLVGLLAATAGMGMVQATNAFIFTKESIMLGQKGDLAMSRLRRSIQNLTTIDGAPTSSSLSIRRLDKGVEITESYSLSGSNFRLNVGGGQRVLTDSVQSLTLSYLHTNGSTWTPAMGIDKLAAINVTTALSGPGGAVVTYVDRIMPRNTYSPKSAFTPAGAGSGGYKCFVASVAYGSGDYPAVRVLRQFRDSVLVKYAGGRKFIEFYYKVGPDLADAFKSSSFLKTLVRGLLLPFVGVAFLLLYFPAGIPLFLLILLLLTRLIVKSDWMQNALKKRSSQTRPLNQKGIVLIWLVLTMVIMATLGGAMVSLYSSANIASVPAYFSQNAYYLAESGRNLAAKMFLANKDSDENFINSLYSSGVSKIFPVGNQGDHFRIKVKTYYFRCYPGAASTTLSVGKWGEFPNNWQDANLSANKTGWLQIPTGASTSTIVRFNLVTNTGAGYLTFNLDSAVAPVAGRVMPVVKLNGAQTIVARNVGDAAGNSLTINIGNYNTNGGFMLPTVSGILSFKDASNKDWNIIYDRVTQNNSSEVILTGIRNYPGKPLPTVGLALADGTPFVLGRYAQIISTGTVGSGMMSIAQTITQNQPLDVVKLYSYQSGAFDPMTPLLGTFATQGDGSIKITQTVQTYSYVGSGISNPTYMQESFQAVSWPNPSPLRTIWEQSSFILSYDLQAKIKFTETEDDRSSSPVNHPGNYMPGIAFRVKCTPGTSNKDCQYYGASFVRGIQGTLRHSGGCGGETYYTEEDDISDNLFEEFGSNSDSRPNAGDIKCSGPDKFVPNFWNSNNPSQSTTAEAAVVLSGGAALDGIPYILLWQKDWSQSAGSCSGAESPWDWLSFMPLVDAKVQKVYHYNATTGASARPEGWYEGTISGDPRNGTSNREGPYTVWKLKDKYGVLKTYTLEGVTILGMSGDAVIRDPATASASSAGLPVSKWASADASNTAVGWILPHAKDSTYSSVSSSDYPYYKARYNYRIYPKPWVTLTAQIVELVGDFDCNSANGEERINAVMAHVSSEDGVAGAIGTSPKDAYRKAYPRNPNYPDISNYTVQWPGVDDYFTMAVWGRGNYSSKTVRRTAENCGWVSVNVKLVEKGKDVDNDDVVAYTSFLTTGLNYFTGYDVPEFGYHTAGISAKSDCTGEHCESVYFTDGYWRAMKGGIAGLIPGIQEQ